MTLYSDRVRRHFVNTVNKIERKNQNTPSYIIKGIEGAGEVYKNTVSFHAKQLGEDQDENEFIKELKNTHYLKFVESIQKVGQHVQIHLNSNDAKKDLLKVGLPFKGGKLLFRDPQIRVHSFAMVDCPTLYTLDELSKIRSNFGTLHTCYNVTKTIEKHTFKNGNRVFQYRGLALPPKQLLIDCYQVRLVYSQPGPRFLTEELRGELLEYGDSEETTVWGGGVIKLIWKKNNKNKISRIE